MEQRTKRFLKIWAGVIVKTTAYTVLGIGTVVALAKTPPLITAALIVAAFLVFISWMTWQIAKMKLANIELKEARVFLELSKDTDTPPVHTSYAAAMKARLAP